jgi:hypothetical protein
MSSPPTATYQTPSCFVCGRVSLIELPAATAAALSAGVPAQGLLPELPRPEREQLISGTHPACWTAAFGGPNPE